MKKHTPSSVLAVATLGILWARPGRTCDQTTASINMTDNVVFALHGCSPEYIDRANWHWANLHIDEDDWSDHGVSSGPCVISTDYAKHVNAWWLVASMPHLPLPGSLPPPNLIQPRRAFHDHDDYGFIVDGNDTDWHDTYKHIAVDSYAFAGLFEHFFLFSGTDQSDTFCPVYDPTQGPTMNNVAQRAMTMVHEGWHGWGFRNLNSDYADMLAQNRGGHELGPQGLQRFLAPIGNCTNGQECDHFRPHRTDEFISRELKNAGRKTGVFSGAPLRHQTTFHSVYQVEIEFACDLADYGADFLPYSVREAAAIAAKNDMTTTIVETVPFFCGSTRPFWTKDPGAIPPNTLDECLDQPNRVNCGRNSMGVCPADSGGCGADGCCLRKCASPNPADQCRGIGDNANRAYSCGASCNPQTGCCVTAPKPLKVSATMSATGPDICIHGEGFTPGASVQVQYLNVPFNPSTQFANFAAPVGADGTFDLRDQSQDKAFTLGQAQPCSVAAGAGVVTVQAVESGLSGLTSKTTIEADLWCFNLSQPTTVNGGCP